MDGYFAIILVIVLILVLVYHKKRYALERMSYSMGQRGDIDCITQPDLAQCNHARSGYYDNYSSLPEGYGN